MKKNKPIRENLTPEELENYFSGAAYDYKRDFIRKLMCEHPEATDPFVIGSATEEMLEAAESGVLLSTDDALRLVEYKVPMTAEEAVRQLRELGMTGTDFMNIVTADIPSGDVDHFGCAKSARAEKNAHWLIRFAYILTQNEDIILTRLPYFDYYDDQTCLTLAFLSEDLSGVDKGALNMMKKYADEIRTDNRDNVMRVRFIVRNIWDK